MLRSRKIVLAILFTSLALRLVLAYINREANDYHLDAIEWIADKGQIPQRDDCLECSQPKLFYILSAGVIVLFKVHTSDNRMVAIQFFNAITGFFTVLLFWKFIKKQPISKMTQVLVLSFFAFNPCLTGINIQVTNDTLEIFGGVLAVYFCDSFFRNPGIGKFILLLIAVWIATLTKTNGILLAAVIVILFIIKTSTQTGFRQRVRMLKFLIPIVLCFLCVPFAGGYYTYYKKYNSLPASTWEKPPPPYFFKDSCVLRPGIVNVATGYFTFRYFDMIRQPYINNEINNYPLHRTSLWSQLYGRTVFLQFDQCPPSWRTHAPVVIFIGRVLIIFGIIPLFLFLWGCNKGAFTFVKNIMKRGKFYLAGDNNYLHLFVTVTLLAAIVKYSYDYRDFCFMKSIFIFPGLISFIKLFIDGYLSVKNLLFIKFINIILIIMIVFSIADIGHLIYQLHYRF